MSQIVYPAGCDADVQSHVCDPCPTKELARVRGLAAVADTFTFTDITDEAEWSAGILAGDIVVIPKTNGEYDGGEAAFTEGFGDVTEEYDSSTFTITGQDPNYLGNHPFWNSIRKSRTWKVAWRTETMVYLSDRAATWKGKDPHPNDPKASIKWEFEIVFVQVDNPVPAVMPTGIFDCYEIVA